MQSNDVSDRSPERSHTGSNSAQISPSHAKNSNENEEGKDLPQKEDSIFSFGV